MNSEHHLYTLKALTEEIIAVANEKQITVQKAKKLVMGSYPGDWNESIRRLIDGIKVPEDDPC